MIPALEERSKSPVNLTSEFSRKSRQIGLVERSPVPILLPSAAVLLKPSSKEVIRCEGGNEYHEGAAGCQRDQKELKRIDQYRQQVIDSKHFWDLIELNLQTQSLY